MFLVVSLLLACDGATTDESDDTTDAVVIEAICTEAAEIPCEDDLYLDFSLQPEVSEGAVTTTTDGEDFVTEVDARAGGTEGASKNPWVYLRFDAEGALKVEIDDEAALDSLDWHLAAKRFQIRMNGGTSGPSCVGAQGLDGAYADVSADDIDDAGEWSMDKSYTEACAFKADQSGLPTSPALALGDWWSYSGCVATTQTPFVVRLDDGRVVKLVVEEYYAKGQEGCNNNGAPGSDSGRLRIRWAWLR